ncbi:hypothetical protein HAX54_052663, partial [Datura stramonium]|nr:hypothetical protein [Datura stramonium]
ILIAQLSKIGLGSFSTFVPPVDDFPSGVVSPRGLRLADAFLVKTLFSKPFALLSSFHKCLLVLSSFILAYPP